jgi:hypothetical protein
MHYPWWSVPFLTSPMLIALIAVLHVLIAHYAVGGGLFLAIETQYAYRQNHRGYLAYLREVVRGHTCRDAGRLLACADGIDGDQPGPSLAPDPLAMAARGNPRAGRSHGPGTVSRAGP